MIEVEQLTKTYGDTAAIKDVSFAVEPGEILGFLGPNGAGKTTTMRILTGYLPATAGTARVAGKDVHSESIAVRQRIGYLPETPPLYPEMTVDGYLTFVARIKGVPSGDISSRVASAMKRCNLEEKRGVIIRKLSKGFRQRVGIAQAIVHNPPVIVLDEPTVGLDPRQIIDVRNLIKSLAGEHTIILSTHILPEVSMTCDRITIINRGEIVATDSPDQLVERLSSQGGYRLEIQGDPDRALAILRDVPGVQSAEIIGGSAGLAEMHRRYQLVTDAEEDIGSVIAARVVQQDLGLFELSRTRASLEDVFINLTREEAGIAMDDDAEAPDPLVDPTETEQSDQDIDSEQAESESVQSADSSEESE